MKKNRVSVNFDHFPYRKELIPEDKVEYEQFFKKLATQFATELKESEKGKKYLEKYADQSKDDFISRYVDWKISLVKSYNYYFGLLNERDTLELKYQNYATEALKSILKKKLFNMELQWRAGQLEIEEVKISFDFLYWHQNIMACPFIPMITPEEIALMKSFLLSLDDPYPRRPWELDIPDYQHVMEKDENGNYSDMPDWFEYYDSRMGTNLLLLLPDKKGPIEEMYINLARKTQKKAKPAKKSPPPPADKRPVLSGYIDFYIEFARETETDPYILKLFDGMEIHIQKIDRESSPAELEGPLATLQDADRPIYFDSHLVWYKAILKAASQYKNQKVAEALDTVYEQYVTYKELGFTYELDNKFGMNDTYQMIREQLREAILDAREMRGEPRDFNY
ncbi:hypothetical protein PbJCM13498_34730 [Prolixibacter bellariivorans]|uniref:Uncharacterized protein n=1 Tax=Prolixibacter bellariivorans TaxID=314319 RepID=A0A5M4B384_9BACT|nr:hypothetical protein [Prolixibacter bellariivorans]GET34610.1 hypothetical protein PbJCM13498_34730 [Prolixibacter bellariivorans]